MMGMVESITKVEIPSAKMKIGSRMILITAPIIVVSILIFANPCVVMKGFIP